MNRHNQKIIKFKFRDAPRCARGASLFAGLSTFCFRWNGILAMMRERSGAGFLPVSGVNKGVPDGSQ